MNKNNYALDPIHLSEPWFSLVCAGIKTVEGRPAKEKYLNLKSGNKLLFYNNDLVGEMRKCVRIVDEVKVYKSFQDYLTKERLGNALPTVPTIQMGVKVYRQWYSPDIEKNGVVAIRLKKI